MVLLSNLLFFPIACGCSEGSKGDYQHNRTCENRFYYDPRYDNALAFLWVPGQLPSHGHWDASTAFGKVGAAGNDSTLANSSLIFKPFQWEHETWPGLIEDYVAKLSPRPTWLYLNSHYWPNAAIPTVGPDIVQAASKSEMKTIWSTATISKNFKAQTKFRYEDREMCAIVDHCLNNTWMERDLKSRDLFDYFHFKPHVYKVMNTRLLAVLGHNVE